MAVFKVIKGKEANLNQVSCHEGYAYLCEDTHNFWIDTSNDISGRVQLNARAAAVLKNGDTEINIDDVDLKSVINSVAEGGTGKTTLDVNAVLLGNGTEPIKTVKGTGALYIGADGIPQFGVLPIEAGGTGSATADNNSSGGGYVTAGQKAGTTLGDKVTAEGYDTTAEGKYSHAEGLETIATDEASHAEGYKTSAGTSYSHAEGRETKVNGGLWGGHAEGYQTETNGTGAHAEGQNTAAFEDAAHAEGMLTKATGEGAHAEGKDTRANTPISHAEGNGTWAQAKGAHAEGCNTRAGGGKMQDGNIDSDSFGDYIYDTEGNYVYRGSGAHAEGDSTHSYGEASHTEGVSTQAYSKGSHAEGGNTIAGDYTSDDLDQVIPVSGQDYAHAEGNATRALGEAAHAEGKSTSVTGNYGHAEGEGSTATGIASHAENKATVSGDYAHAEGDQTKALGKASHVEGHYSKAYGDASHAEGSATTGEENPSDVYNGMEAHAEGSGTAIGLQSHAEGKSTLAKGDSSHAEGNQCKTFAQFSHAEGDSTICYGYAGHAEGASSVVGDRSNPEADVNIASYSHAEGWLTNAMGKGCHAAGFYTTAKDFNYVIGHCNKTPTAGTYTTKAGDAFIIGNGNTGSYENAFRVTYTGETYGLSSFNATGADYAEYFEWVDSNPDNEDRVGYFVTFKDERKIKKANSGDYILGVVSGEPCIIGNADEDWLHRWEHDEFGRFMQEEIKIVDMLGPSEGKVDSEGHPIKLSQEERLQWEKNRYKISVINRNDERPSVDAEGHKITYDIRYKANPNYDPSQKYVGRKDRKEWDAVGMMGVLAVRDDGTCVKGGFCRCADGGIATKSDTGYYVIRRVTDGVIEIIMR